MNSILAITSFLPLILLIKSISGLGDTIETKMRGDLGQLLHSQQRPFHEVVKRSENSYRYYGTGSKGSTSLLPTSPSKSSSHFSANDAYSSGSGSGYRSAFYKPTKNSVQDITNYLQLYESESLPADFGEMAAASGHGHSSGYGHGGGGHGKGCNSALGLLGVLGLAAYLQSVLQSMNATGRRRRSVVREQMIKMTDSELKQFLSGNESIPDAQLSKKPETVISGLLPVLSAVAHARDGLIPITCTYRQICSANGYLVEKVGSVGRSVGALLSSEIGKLLMEVDRRRGPVILKSINKVAQLGRSGHDCNSLFQDCDALKYLPVYSMPPNTRFSRFPHRILQQPPSPSERYSI